MTPAEQIKERLELVEFVKGYLDLKPAGRNFKALCPFHQEKTPSFIVSPERQIWHCFGCNLGGDIFKFLMHYENLEFYEALAILAEKAGIELKKISPAEQRQFGILYEINTAAAQIFEENLEATKDALDYLKERGLKEETIKEFELGLSALGADELTVNLINRGFSINDIVRAGLAVRTEKGQYLDRFRARIIFPLHNHFGKIVGFSGRVLPQFEAEETAKYLNTPETPIFNKSRLLYGFWQSKKFVREEGAVLLVEGQMDFLLSWQDGVKNVVASSGTALTSDHLRVLRRLTGKLIVGFDLDEAGQTAIQRNIDLAGAHDFTVFILPLGKFSDPAEAALRQPGFVKEAITRAKTAMEYYFDRYLKRDNLETIDKSKTALRLVLSKIKTLWSPVERSHWLRELAHRTGIPEKELAAEMGQLGDEEGMRRETREAEEKKKLERRELIALRLLSLAALKKDFDPLIEPYLGFMPELYQKAYGLIVGQSWGGQASAAELEEIINFVTLRSGIEFANFEEDKLKEELSSLLGELQYEHLKQMRNDTGRLVLLAEQSGSEEELIKHLKQLDEIVKKLHDLKM